MIRKILVQLMGVAGGAMGDRADRGGHGDGDCLEAAGTNRRRHRSSSSHRTTRASRFVRVGAAAAGSLLVLSGCAGGREDSRPRELSRHQALQLAINLANQECQAKFSSAPFDTSSSRIQFVDGRWSWGGLDLATPHGFSADVSFDAYGSDPRVEVYLSADGLSPNLPRDSTRQRE